MHESADIINALLHQGESVRFRAGGHSMTPTIRDGDMVMIRPCGLNSPPRGAVIFYRAHGRLILHRLIKTVENKAETIADAALEGKETIRLEDIAGVAVWVMRGGERKRLDRGLDRWLGLFRYWSRPCRRVFLKTYHAHRVTSPQANDSKTSAATGDRVK
ncbi:MAG: S24 family peptidase [Kiritimatiellia bacterium]